MKSVRVDHDKCRGHALCLRSAPEVFDWLDVDDQAFVPEGLDVSGHEENITSAYDNCPERAIVVGD